MLSSRISSLFVAAVAVLWATSLPVRADTFDFSYSFPTTDTADFPSGQTSASGQFIATDLGGGKFVVTNVTGSWNGETITGVAPLNSDGNNDNWLFPAGPYFDIDGVAFAVSGPIKGDDGSGFVDVYFVSGGGYTDYGAFTGFSSTFNLSPAVPEPSTWALMILGFCGLGFMAHRRRNQLCGVAA